MKSRLIATATITLLLSIAVPGFSNDIAVAPKASPTEGTSSPEVQQMLNRLEEIKGMDIKSMPRSERRALRKEVKEIEQKMQSGGVVVISVGTLIIILLLLLLLV